MYTEITQLRAELSKKKETVHHLTLTQGDLKQSFHRTELQLKMQSSQQLDKVRHLESELAKLNKQLKKATVSKETILQVRIIHGMYNFSVFTYSTIAFIMTIENFPNGKFRERYFLGKR